MSAFVGGAAGRLSATGRARNAPLAPLTTFRVGGPADWLVEPRSGRRNLVAPAAGAPRRSAGHDAWRRVERAGGRRGRRGIVMRPRGGKYAALDDDRTSARTRRSRINGLVRWTINHGCAGLEAWAGTPGTVGGAHLRQRAFRRPSDRRSRHRGARRHARRIGRRRAARRDGVRLRSQPPAAHRRDPAVGGLSRVAAASPAALRAAARESLAFRKRTQPLDTPSAGCIFQNPEPGRDEVPDGIPWSAGALVDRAGLKVLASAARGSRRRTATSSSTTANATASDIRQLIDPLPRRRARAFRRRVAGRDRLSRMRLVYDVRPA